MLLAVSFVYGWFAEPDAGCCTSDGYDQMRAHAELLGTPALLAVPAAAAGGIVCVVGAVAAGAARSDGLTHTCLAAI